MFLNSGYEVIITGIEAAFIAQVLKFIGYSLWNRKVDFSVLTTTGRMPSSHTAGVTAVSATVGIITGFESIEFAIALTYTLVVMYDAAGLRRSTGKIASCLNKIMEEIYTHGQAAPERLKELLGHTPLEVFGGAILGIGLAFLNHYYVFQ